MTNPSFAFPECQTCALKQAPTCMASNYDPAQIMLYTPSLHDRRVYTQYTVTFWPLRVRHVEHNLFLPHLRLSMATDSFRLPRTLSPHDWAMKYMPIYACPHRQLKPRYTPDPNTHAIED